MSSVCCRVIASFAPRSLSSLCYFRATAINACLVVRHHQNERIMIGYYRHRRHTTARPIESNVSTLIVINLHAYKRAGRRLFLFALALPHGSLERLPAGSIMMVRRTMHVAHWPMHQAEGHRSRSNRPIAHLFVAIDP